MIINSLSPKTKEVSTCSSLKNWNLYDLKVRILAYNFQLSCREIRRTVIVLFVVFTFSQALNFRIELVARQTLVVLASLTENKDRAPTCSRDRRRVVSSQDEVPFTGELQYKLPAPPQTSDFRGDNWPLARPQRIPMEVCSCSAKERCLHDIITWYPFAYFCPHDIAMVIVP